MHGDVVEFQNRGSLLVFSWGTLLSSMNSLQNHMLVAAWPKSCQHPDTRDPIWKWAWKPLEKASIPCWILILTLWRVAWKSFKASPLHPSGFKAVCGLWLGAKNIFQMLWNCPIGHHTIFVGNAIAKTLKVQPQASMWRKFAWKSKISISRRASRIPWSWRGLGKPPSLPFAWFDPENGKGRCLAHFVHQRHLWASDRQHPALCMLVWRAWKGHLKATLGKIGLHLCKSCTRCKRQLADWQISSCQCSQTPESLGKVGQT